MRTHLGEWASGQVDTEGGVRHLRWGSVLLDAPMNHDRRMVGHRQSRSHELLDQENGDALLGQFGDQFIELGHDQWRHTTKP